MIGNGDVLLEDIPQNPMYRVKTFQKMVVFVDMAINVLKLMEKKNLQSGKNDLNIVK